MVISMGFRGICRPVINGDLSNRRFSDHRKEAMASKAMILDGWGMKMTTTASYLGSFRGTPNHPRSCGNTLPARCRSRHLTWLSPRLDHFFKFESHGIHGDLWIPHFKKPHIFSRSRAIRPVSIYRKPMETMVFSNKFTGSQNIVRPIKK